MRDGPRYYMLVGKFVLPVENAVAWARSFERHNRTIAYDMIGDKLVSTVFLGIDHSFGLTDEPTLFETMVFTPPSWGDEKCERYSTWDQAMTGHLQMCHKVLASMTPTKRFFWRCVLWLRRQTRSMRSTQAWRWASSFVSKLKWRDWKASFAAKWSR